MGHAGTLDPIATGVLPVFFGKATKAIKYLKNTDKEYIAEFKLGVKTDTKDFTGNILKREKTNIKKEEWEEALRKFVGEIEQIPPMYSAVKVDGVALYKLARQGKSVNRPKRNVYIFKIESVKFNEQKQEGVVKICCSSGTYIRTLIEDIAMSLKTVAVIVSLKRVMACGFCLNESLSLDEIKIFKEQNILDKHMLPVEFIFKELKKIRLDNVLAKKFLNGVQVQAEEKLQDESLVRVYNKKFLGIAKIKDGIVQIEKSFI